MAAPGAFFFRVDPISANLFAPRTYHWWDRMKLPFQASDEQVMWRVQNESDSGAFAELVRRWQLPVQRLCARMTGDVHRAEDLSQETFSRVFSHRHDFASTGRFSTWLWRIALNLCHDELRKRQRRGEVAWTSDDGEAAGAAEVSSTDVRSAARGPDEVLESMERAELVRSAVVSLPEHYRTVVILRHYEGLRFAEIAEVLGIPEGTAKSRMAEGLTLLAGRIQRGSL